MPSKFNRQKIVKLLNKSPVCLLLERIIKQKSRLQSVILNKLFYMYAIVDIAGQQFKVEKERRIFVNRLKAAEGESITFDKVLLVDNDGSIKVGAPYIDGASVTATVLAHLKGDKVIVFKKKRRKGYTKKNGHRQYLTQIQIVEIA